MFLKFPWYSIGRLALVFVCLVLFLILAVIILPIHLDITAFKEPFEELLTSFAKAPTTIEAIGLRPSLWPTLTVEGVDVQGIGYDKAPPFSHIDTAEIQISLLPLLNKRIEVKRFFASGLSFHAHRPEDTDGNWPVWTDMPYEISELANLELEKVTIFLDDHELGQANLIIDRLVGGIAADRPLDLNLEGSLNGQPLVLTASGPTLAALSPKASDIPLVAHLELADLVLDIDGTASRQPDGTRARFAVRVESPGTQFLRSLRLNIEPPDIGGFALAATISSRLERIDLDGLEGRVGTSSVRGSLSLARQGELPMIEGGIFLDRLSLGPLLSSGGQTASEKATPLGFSYLLDFDADLEIAIRRIEGVDWDLEEFTTRISLESGKLVAPMKLTAADVPVTAQVEIDARTQTPQVTAEARLEKVDLSQLESLFEIDERLTGTMDLATVIVSTNGDTLADLTDHLAARVEIRDARLTLPDETGEEPIDLFLERTQIRHQSREPLALTASGRLFETPFTLELRTASPTTLLASDIWPIDLRMAGAGAEIAIAGNLARQGEGVALDLEFDLAGDQLSGLEDWLGISPEAQHPYLLKGHLTTTGQRRRLDFEESTLGRTRFRGDFTWETGEAQTPTLINLRVATLDLRELQSLFDPVTRLDTEEASIGVDLPVLPNRVHFGDAEIELTVDRFMRQTVDLTDLSASFHFREGRLEPSPFSFHYRTSSFQGEINLDLREETPRFALSVSGKGDALGEVLDREDLVRDLAITAAHLTLDIDAEGATIRQIVRSADISGRLDDVRWQIQPPDSENALDIQLESILLSGPKDQPIVLQAKGLVDQHPLDVRLELRFEDGQREDSDQTIPFRLDAEIAATNLRLVGNLDLPLTNHDMDFQLSVSATDLSTLSPVVGTDLPDLGPFRLDAHLDIAEGAYSLTSLEVSVAESNLQGTLRYEKPDGRPTISADLNSRLIRTVDVLPDRSPSDAGEEPTTPPATESDWTLRFLEDFDASIHLEVQTIETGAGPVEGLSVDATLDQGTLDVSATRPQEGAEDARLTAQIEPLERGVEASFTLYWSRQPYGLFGDILNPETAQGSWSVDIDLSSKGSTYDELLTGLEGHVDFTDYPDDIDATILDLWGGGLVNSVLPVFNLGQESRVNCTVGRFLMEGGILTPEVLIIDSTRSRVRGKGSIDLPANRIQLRLKPRPKQRSLINLATPVVIRGPLTKPSVRVATGGMAVTFFRFSLWIYTVWREVFRTPLPADGSDICLDPPRRTTQ